MPGSSSTRRKKVQEHSDVDETREEAQKHVKKEKKPPARATTAIQNGGGGDQDDDNDEDDDILDSERIDVDNLENQPLARGHGDKLQGIMKDWTNIEDNARRAHRNVIDVVDHLVEFTEEDERDKGVKKLDLLLRELNDLGAEMQAHKAAIDETYQKLVTGEQINNVIERYERGSAAKMEEYSQKTARQKYGNEGSSYLQFKKTVFSARNPDEPVPPPSSFIPREAGDESDDEDFEIGGVTQDYRCPLTLQPYVDPMITPCGHHFSREGLRVMLSGSGSKKCAATGCQARYSWFECKPDPQMARKVKAWQRREEARKESQVSEIID